MRLRGLRQARQRQGMSISQLADEADLRRDSLSRLEHGQEEVEPSLVRRLALILGVSQGELIYGGVVPHPV